MNDVEVVVLKEGVSGVALRELGLEACRLPPPEPAERSPTYREVQRQVREMNLEHGWTEISTAACLLIGAITVGTDPEALRAWSWIPLRDVKRIHRRLRLNHIWGPNGELRYFGSDDPTEQAVEFCLLAMCGAGLVVHVPTR